MKNNDDFERKIHDADVPGCRSAEHAEIRRGAMILVGNSHPEKLLKNIFTLFFWGLFIYLKSKVLFRNSQ